MPGFAADIVDSMTADYDISDDGYDFGPVTTWPAPVLPPDDRNSAYKLSPDQARRQRGLYDAYALLRAEPTNPMARGPVRVTRADAHGFLAAQDAAWLHDACSIYDAGAVTRDRLLAGQQLRRGDSLTSKNGQFLVAMQTDGNFVLYRKGGGAIWDAGTTGRGAVAVMQTDGNFVIYNAANQPLWASNTAGRKGAFFVVQDDANLVIYVGTSPVWTADTAGGVKHTHSSSLFDKIGGVVSSVGSGIAHAASDVVKVAAPLASVVKTIAPFAQTALSFVPGVGTVVNGAIAAGSALAQGKSITDAMLSTVAAAVPGGPLAQQAFKAGVAIVKGQPITTAALNAVRDQIPGGLAAKAAFDTAVALAHGQNVQQAALSGVRTVAEGAAPALINQGKAQVMDQLSPFYNRVYSAVGPRVSNIRQALPSLLPTQARMVAQAILNDPHLRSLPAAEVARRMNTTERDARQGIASVVQAVSRAGGGQIPHLSQAGDLADRIGTRMSFDDAIATYASRATRPIFTHNRIRTVRRFVGARGFIDAGSFIDAGALPATIQQGSTGAAVTQWQQIIGVKADGIFGPQTKAATITWQKAHGLVADGIVGPKTWTAALGSPAPASPVPSAPVPIPVPPPVLTTAPALPAPPPVVVTTLANQLPMLKVGSTGPAVVKWQQIVGVKADGIFGPQTQAATKAWQAQRGLVADGIVGPKTWAAAMTTPTSTSLPLPPPTTQVNVPTPIGPIAVPIPNVPLPPLPIPGSPPPPPPPPIDTLPPSVTTFPVPPIAPPPGGTPPFIPGQVSTVSTPEGPITGVTDRTGSTVTVTEPTITGSPPASSSGPGAIGALLVLGTLIAVGSSGRKGFL